MAHRPQSANRLTERVHAAVRSRVGATTDRNLLVACSGGADSSALAHAVATVGRQEGWRVTLGHVRHGVRLDDVEDMRIVHGLAESLGIAFVYDALEWPADASTNDQSEKTLRVGRYAALARMCHTAGATAIVTGHTMDDQAETVLMHLVRGSGLDGLAAMQPSTPFPYRGHVNASSGHNVSDAHILRPLLGISRAETEAYCAAHRLAVVNDPTNDDQRWTRNWMRHTVLPTLRARHPSVTETLASAAEIIGRDARFLAEETERALVRCGHTRGADVSTLDRQSFVNESPALRMRIARTLLMHHSDDVPRADLVTSVDEYLSHTHSSRIVHFGRVAFSVVGRQVVAGLPDPLHAWIVRNAVSRYPLFRGNLQVSVGTPVSLGHAADGDISHTFVLQSVNDHLIPEPPRYIESCVYLTLPADPNLTIRNRAPHDRFQPADRHHDLLLQDYLQRRKIPVLVRDWLPLLVVNDTIAGVIGHEFAAEFVTSRDRATHVALLLRASG